MRATLKYRPVVSMRPMRKLLTASSCGTLPLRNTPVRDSSRYGYVSKQMARLFSMPLSPRPSPELPAVTPVVCSAAQQRAR